MMGFSGITPRQKGRAMRTSLTAHAALLTCFLMMGCSRSESKVQTEPSPVEAVATRHLSIDPAAESRSRGAKLYEHYCAICHGAEGKGDGFNSSNLAVPPRDFSDPQFCKQATDERLLLAVSKGGPAVGKSVLMQPWGRTLTDSQIRDVVTFLRTMITVEKPKEDGSLPLEKSK